MVSLRRLSTVRPCDRDELKKLIQGDDCFVVDVRENEEVLATGPIYSRAINIPLSQFLLDDDGEANIIFERLMVKNLWTSLELKSHRLATLLSSVVKQGTVKYGSNPTG